MFPFESIITIERESKKPVYTQIAGALLNAIMNGILKPGAPLLSSREMSIRLGVHRKTVIAAYEELIAQDWIRSVPRKGIYVSERIPQLSPRKWSSHKEIRAYEYSMDIPVKNMKHSIKRDEDTSALQLIIDDGYPDVRLSPMDTLLKSYRYVLTKKSSIQQSKEDNAKGSMRLREQLAHSLSETRGLNISGANILISHGAQMSIYVAAHLLIERSTTVIIGKPGYPIATNVFNQLGANVIEVSVDQFGLDVDEVKRICEKQDVNLLYVIPHHHYPTTVTLSIERRMQLLELSKKFSFVIIEDDYDYDYHYDSSPYLPLASANHHGNIIYIGSFSKILAPSLRIGFMVAPENFIEQAAIFRKTIDVGGDLFMQDALALLIEEGILKRHITKAKKLYQQRRDYLNNLMTERFKGRFFFSLPGGGMAIWVQVDKNIPIRRLCEILIKYGLKIKVFDEEKNAFRFGFASLTVKELDYTIELLEDGIKSILQKVC